MIDLAKLEFLLNKAKEAKEEIKTIYNDTLVLTDPFSEIKDEGKTTLNEQRSIDSDVVDAIDTLTSYIMSSILPRNGKWADLEVDANRMKELFGESVKTQIDEINKNLSSDIDNVFSYIQASNYYAEIAKSMKSFVRLGTGAYCIRETGSVSKPFKYEYVGLDNLFILEDSLSRPNIVFKLHPEINGETVIDLFGKDSKLPQELNEKEFDKTINVFEITIPNFDETKNITTYSYIVCTEDLKNVIIEKELEYNPFIVFRWDVIEGSPWGSSVVLNNKNLLEELKNYKNIFNTQATKIANPPSIFYGNQELYYQLSNEEGTLNYGGDPSKGAVNSQFQNIGVSSSLMPLDQLITDCRNRFKRALMVEQIGMSAVDAKYTTATAVQITHELFRKRFSNTYELINSELLEPTFMNPFIIMLKSQSLTLTTEVLPFMGIRYINELSRTNDNSDVNNLMNYISVVMQATQANMMGVAFDLPKTITYISNKMGVDKTLIPTEQELQDIQDYRIQQQQQQEQQQAIAQEGVTNAQQ